MARFEVPIYILRIFVLRRCLFVFQGIKEASLPLVGLEQQRVVITSLLLFQAKMVIAFCIHGANIFMSTEANAFVLELATNCAFQPVCQ